VRGLHQIIQSIHFIMQQIDPFAPDFALVKRNSTLKPTVGLAAGPFILHDMRELRLAPISAGMKCEAPELSVECFVTPFPLDLPLLIM
jgi:hypothetical protein